MSEAKAPEPAKDQRPESPQGERPAPTESKGSASKDSPSTPATPPAKAAQSQAAPAKAAPSQGTAKPATSASQAPARAPKRRGGGGGAAALATLALIVAVGGLAVSLYALDVAREAKSAAAPTLPALSPSPSAAPLSPSPVASATPTASPSPTLPPTPRATYVPEISGALLSLPVPERCLSVLVDVDTLQVGVDAGHDFYVSNCMPPLSVRVDRAYSATPVSQGAGPDECAATLAGATLTSELVLPAREGLTFCLLTSPTDAARQNIPQRLAIVAIQDVRPDNSLRIMVNSYRVEEPRP